MIELMLEQFIPGQEIQGSSFKQHFIGCDRINSKKIIL